jgi:hypothetical protein
MPRTGSSALDPRLRQDRCAIRGPVPEFEPTFAIGRSSTKSPQTRSKMNPARSGIPVIHASVYCLAASHQVNDGVVVMRLRTGLDVLEYEIRQEQAATIGRLAQELRDALDALDTFDRRANSGKTAADSGDLQRARLVDAAAYPLWNFVVQRECSGFRWTEQVLKDYAVPVEVRAKMGAIRPPS